MENNEEIQIGAYVRVLRDSEYMGIKYYKDEVWRVDGKPNWYGVADVSRDGKNTRMLITNSKNIEAEYIGMSIPEETYNIY